MADTTESIAAPDEWLISEPKVSVKWAEVIEAACKALDSDEKLAYARIGAYAAKPGTMSNVRKVLATFPALNARFHAVNAKNGAKRDVAIVRTTKPVAAEAK